MSVVYNYVVLEQIGNFRLQHKLYGLITQKDYIIGSTFNGEVQILN